MSEYSDIEIEKEYLSFLPNFSFDDTDLVVKDGDLSLISGEASIKRSIVKRLTTFKGSYAVLVRSFQEIVNNAVNQNPNTLILNSGANYGSDIHALLSEPLTVFTVNRLKSKIYSTISGDSRVTVNDVNIDVNTTNGLITASVSYTLKSSGQQSTVSMDLTSLV